MARQVAFLRWRILFLSRNVLDTIRYVALFYVVHVIHWLLKYLTSSMINTAKFEEDYLFNPVWSKIHGIWGFAVWHDVDKYLMPRNNPLFFQERISHFQICYTEWPCHFYFKVPRSCLFLYFCFNIKQCFCNQSLNKRDKSVYEKKKMLKKCFQINMALFLLKRLPL